MKSDEMTERYKDRKHIVHDTGYDFFFFFFLNNQLCLLSSIQHSQPQAVSPKQVVQKEAQSEQSCCDAPAGACEETCGVWICKPTDLNQGRGIFLLHSTEDISAFRARLQTSVDNQSNSKLSYRLPQARIVQKWVKKKRQNLMLQAYCTAVLARLVHGHLYSKPNVDLLQGLFNFN